MSETLNIPTSLSHTPQRRAATYARVSTGQQAERELPILGQQRECRSRALQDGFLVITEYVDEALSASRRRGQTVNTRLTPEGHIESTMTTDRLGLLALLSAAERGEFEVLFIYHSDRLSREDIDPLMIKALLKQAGVQIISVTEPFFGGQHPMDEVMEALTRSQNKLEVAKLRERSKRGLKAAALLKGRINGPPPYGYRMADSGRKGAGWIADESTAERVRYLYQYYLTESPTFAEFVRHLNAVGVPPPCIGMERFQKRKKLTWHSNGLRRVLSSRIYLGEVHYEGQWYPGAHEAIVDVETFNSVQDILSRRARGKAEVSETLFAGGLLRCPLCAAEGFVSPLYVHRQKEHLSKKGQLLGPYHQFTCGIAWRAGYQRQIGVEDLGNDIVLRGIAVNEWRCPGFNITEKRVMALFVEALTQVAQSFPDEITAPTIKTVPLPLERIAFLQSELDALPRLRANYQSLFATDRMTIEELDSALAQVKERESALLNAVRQAEETAPPKLMSPPVASDILSIVSSSALNFRQKRDRLKAVFDYIVPSADKNSLFFVLR